MNIQSISQSKIKDQTEIEHTSVVTLLLKNSRVRVPALSPPGAKGVKVSADQDMRDHIYEMTFMPVKQIFISLEIIWL